MSNKLLFNYSENSADYVLRLMDVIQKLLEETLSRVKIIDENFQSFRRNPRGLRERPLCMYCNQVYRFLRVLDPLDTQDKRGLEWIFEVISDFCIQVPPFGLFQLLFFLGEPNIANPASRLANMIDTLELESFPSIPLENGGRLTPELVDQWHNDAVLFEKAVKKTVNETIPNLVETWSIPGLKEKWEEKQQIDKDLGQDKPAETGRATERFILSPKAATVFDMLKELPDDRGLTGPQILDILREEHDIIMDGGTLTKTIIPELKKHYRVKNQRRRGYYIEK